RLDYTVQYYGYAQQLLDPDELYGQYWLCKASRNWTGFCDAKFDAMFPAMSSESDPAKRFTLARQMEDYLLREQFTYVPAPRAIDGWVWWTYVHPHPQAAGQPQWYRSWYTEHRKETWWRDPT
ncbi:MAG: hypothetical protein HY680_04485, partial [Chloroflexi bacterium]|nr:hypothetical protein [Chloroflexota bacterium]